MDAHMKLLADASLAVGAAEEALADSAVHRAADRLDAAGEALDELRESWLGMGTGERLVIGPGARDVRARLDAARRRLPA